jgi:hypothetical protein
MLDGSGCDEDHDLNVTCITYDCGQTREAVVSETFPMARFVEVVTRVNSEADVFFIFLLRGKTSTGFLVRRACFSKEKRQLLFPAPGYFPFGAFHHTPALFRTPHAGATSLGETGST